MIKKKFLDEIRRSKKCRAQLQLTLDKTAQTITRYIDNNDIMLTTSAALDVIKEYTGATQEELLEKVSA